MISKEETHYPDSCVLDGDFLVVPAAPDRNMDSRALMDFLRASLRGTALGETPLSPLMQEKIDGLRALMRQRVCDSVRA